MKKIKIGYFADGPWAHNAFKLISADERFSIQFICVRYNSEDLVLKGYCEKYRIGYLKHRNINSPEFIQILKNYNCDLFVSMSFNQIFKAAVINLPPLKTINCHAGKLPFYRGRNVLNWVLINDEKEFGITVHYIDEGIDTGDIITQELYPITDDDNYNSILKKAQQECAAVLFKALLTIYNSDVKPVKQICIHPTGFYCTGRENGDEKINWNSTSREVFNFIRAICHPSPMARTCINGNEIKINKASEIPGAPVYKLIPGTVLGISGNELIVKTADSSIRILEYESPVKIKIGDRLQ